MNIPERYIPQNLSNRDKKIQRKNIVKSRKLYRKNKYFTRPKLSSFKSTPSKHVKTAKKMYNITTIKPSRKLAMKTGCSKKTLTAIVDKGRAAYYSGGFSTEPDPGFLGHCKISKFHYRWKC